MTSNRVRVAAISATAALALALGACSSTSGSSNGTSPSQEASASATQASPVEFVTTNLTAKDVKVNGLGPDMTVTFPFPSQASALSSEDIKVGKGKEATATSDVTVNYYLASALTGEKKESSFDSDQAAPLNLTQVIQGWAEGVPGMKAGGERILVVPGDLAYGPDAIPQRGIEANETLVFVVQMVSVDS